MAQAHDRKGSHVIVAKDLEKTYPSATRAVRGFSFRFHKGEILGILGPHGACKSTTIGVLLIRLNYRSVYT